MARVYSWPSMEMQVITFVLMIFSLAQLCRFLLISLSQLVLKQYVGSVCISATAITPPPREK